jgi:predicted RNase H-like HicB family nuclease
MATNKKSKKDLKYYLSLPWTYTIEKESSFYIIYVNELPGVCTDAEDLDQGMIDIQEAIAAAIKLYMKQGDEIPEPVKKEDFKGKIAYRTNSSRHYALVKEAHRRHQSISKVLDDIVDDALGATRSHSKSFRI